MYSAAFWYKRLLEVIPEKRLPIPGVLSGLMDHNQQLIRQQHVTFMLEWH